MDEAKPVLNIVDRRGEKIDYFNLSSRDAIGNAMVIGCMRSGKSIDSFSMVQRQLSQYQFQYVERGQSYAELLSETTKGLDATLSHTTHGDSE